MQPGRPWLYRKKGRFVDAFIPLIPYLLDRLSLVRTPKNGCMISLDYFSHKQESFCFILSNLIHHLYS